MIIAVQEETKEGNLDQEGQEAEANRDFYDVLMEEVDKILPAEEMLIVQQKLLRFKKKTFISIKNYMEFGKIGNSIIECIHDEIERYRYIGELNE